MWRWRDGSRPVSTEYYVTPDYGVDANSSFSLAGLLVLTDARVGAVPGTGQLTGQETGQNDEEVENGYGSYVKQSTILTDVAHRVVTYCTSSSRVKTSVYFTIDFFPF